MKMSHVLSKRMNKEKPLSSQYFTTSTTNLCEDVIHTTKPMMMKNASEKITKIKNNSQWFSNATKKNTTALTIQKNANDRHRGRISHTLQTY